jgi:hypothetical protein
MCVTIIFRAIQVVVRQVQLLESVAVCRRIIPDFKNQGYRFFAFNLHYRQPSTHGADLKSLAVTLIAEASGVVSIQRHCAGRAVFHFSVSFAGEDNGHSTVLSMDNLPMIESTQTPVQ